MLKYLEENNTADEWIVGQYNADWIYSFIESQPDADVGEVKHGEWVEHDSDDGYEHHICSLCHSEAIFTYITEPMYDENIDGEMEYVADVETGVEEHSTDYCQHCGAKMDGGNQNEKL